LRAVAILLHTGPAKRPTAIGRALGRTPRKLIMLGAALETAVAVFIAVLISGMSGADDGMAALSAKAAEAKAANDLYLRLTDMDAQAADALLVGYHPTGSVPREVGAAADMGTYDSERSAADADLQSIGLNPALAAKVRGLLDALGAYESLIGQAVYIDQDAKSEAPAAPPPAALGLYERATAAMHGDILAAASQIRDEDDREIDDSYASARDAAFTYAVLVGLLGLLLAALIVGANQYLSLRFRRIVGPALALAAVITVSVTASAVSGLVGTAHDYLVAKQNAFDSVSALTNAEALSYDANADESRWLLDRTDAFQADFFADADRIAHVDGVAAAAAESPDSYYNGLDAAVLGLSLDAGGNSVSGVRFGGYLGSELDNITFADEAQGADEAANAFNAYIQIDSTMRGDGNTGDLAAAVAIDIGLAPGDSNRAFEAYIKTLQHVVDINQAAFASAVADGENGLSAWSWLPYAAGAALLALIGAALYPRIREYR
jgi:hypothetical protein